jgi:hypothetical protein
MTRIQFVKFQSTIAFYLTWGLLIACDAERDYWALQIHPKAWDDQQFDQFKKIIEHLNKADVTFINLYECFSLMNPE